jgi:hypothetical protein
MLLAHVVCGPERKPDHIQDVARVLRLPGSLNYKYTPPRAVPGASKGGRFTLAAKHSTRRLRLVGVRAPLLAWSAGAERTPGSSDCSYQENWRGLTLRRVPLDQAQHVVHIEGLA